MAVREVAVVAAVSTESTGIVFGDEAAAPGRPNVRIAFNTDAVAVCIFDGSDDGQEIFGAVLRLDVLLDLGSRPSGQGDCGVSVSIPVVKARGSSTVACECSGVSPVSTFTAVSSVNRASWKVRLPRIASGPS